MKAFFYGSTILVISCLLVSGCGTAPLSTSTPPAISTSVPTVARSSTAESTATAPVTSPIYETKVFHPSFTVELPPGWFVAERDPAAAQIYLPCNTCIHEGEENGEVTLDMALTGSSPSEAIARLQMAKNIDATGIQFRMLNRRKGPAVRGPDGEKVEFFLFLKAHL